jgi:hypothetical protein
VPSSTIGIRFGSQVNPTIRSRITYALRVFAAVYGYQVQDSETDIADIVIAYGNALDVREENRVVRVPARYVAQPVKPQEHSITRVRYALEDICLTLGIDETTNNPDWLGEIFQWVSAALESGIALRDSVGRIPYSETVFAKECISPLKPQASLLMAWLENTIQNGNSVEALPKASSPVSGIEHLVVCSHDLDFYFTNKADALLRLSKNLGIALAIYRSPSFFASNSRMAMNLLLGKNIGDYIPTMLDSIEDGGFRSTLFAVAGGVHRRDPNYKIQLLAPQLRKAIDRGFSVGTHASYTSVVEKESLTAEISNLEKAVGKRPQGSRQHWLRFDSHEKLQRVLDDSGLAYDSSLGFSEVCGFRNGASFAFPPYDFGNEKPCSYLEIPLVIMDGSLEAMSRAQKESPQEIADAILNESRKWGWGGISILWHNPVEPIQVPSKVNKVFWQCAKNRKRFAEQWMSADQFLCACLTRYQDAGLLKEIRFHA